jgi:hypothetical protein
LTDDTNKLNDLEMSVPKKVTAGWARRDVKCRALSCLFLIFEQRSYCPASISRTSWPPTPAKTNSGILTCYSTHEKIILRIPLESVNKLKIIPQILSQTCCQMAIATRALQSQSINKVPTRFDVYIKGNRNDIFATRGADIAILTGFGEHLFTKAHCNN